MVSSSAAAPEARLAELRDGRGEPLTAVRQVVRHQVPLDVLGEAMARVRPADLIAMHGAARGGR